MVDGVLGLIGDRSSSTVLVEGIIAQTPGGIDEEIEVTIPSFDPTQRWGPCPWTPRPTADTPDLPSRGDRALIAFAENGNPWILAWWPYE